jgi:hypothetical protein
MVQNANSILSSEDDAIVGQYAYNVVHVVIYLCCYWLEWCITHSHSGNNIVPSCIHFFSFGSSLITYFFSCTACVLAYGLNLVIIGW